jgi:hypothetical protein
MAEMEKIVEKKVYEEGKHCDKYASKSGAYGVGIPALVLGGLAFANQMFGGNGFSLFGGGNCRNGGGAPANVNTLTVNGGDGVSAPSTFQVWQKGCEEALALTNHIWKDKVSILEQMAGARQVDVEEKFGLYKATRDLYDVQTDKMNTMGFGLYKGQRDLYDTLNERYAEKFNALDKKVAVLEATRPYQDRLIQCDIEKAYNSAICYIDKKTCKALYGVVGLPSTPTVTVLQGANPFCNCPAPAQAAG